MSKIKRDSIQIDPCLTSINLLKDRCENFFKNQSEIKSTCRIYIDDPCEKKMGSNHDEIVDFILFGNAYKSFFESGNWIGNKVRIWVLSQSNKKIIEFYLNGKVKVNVIPRYSLFSRSDLPTEFILGDSHDFVFSGRLSAQKNIESILFFVKNYNDKFSVKSNLHLFGDFEDTYHEDLGRRFPESYKSKILNLIKTLNLQNNVILHGKVSREEWIKSNFKSPVFISLSTFISEDFGCAVAEAQQIGWPIIISEYGGHLDVEGSNVVRIPYGYICNSHLPLDLNQIISNKLIEAFSDFSSNPFNPKIDVSLTYQNSIPLSLIDECRRKLISKLGSSISLIHSDYVGAFADTVEGSTFFSKIKHFMKQERQTVLIVLFDFDSDDLSPIQKKSLENIYSKLDLNKFDVDFISSKNLFFKDTMKIILESEHIYIVKDSINVEQLNKYLKDILHLDSEIFSYE